MDVKESLHEIIQMFTGRDWFYDAEINTYGAIVVYAHWMTGEIMRAVPDDINGHRVLLHFAGSKLATREMYTTDRSEPAPIPLTNVKAVELPSSDLESDLSDLTKELDRLEKICGTNILQDIFYEIHDGPNHVTNLSAKYPDVRAGLDKLYNEFGFDIIYEELDG